MSSDEIEIVIPSFGGISINRSNKKVNHLLMDFLSEVVDNEIKIEIDNFFKESDDIEVIFGDESLCG
jgi:hypothetical protein